MKSRGKFLKNPSRSNVYAAIMIVCGLIGAAFGCYIGYWHSFEGWIFVLLLLLLGWILGIFISGILRVGLAVDDWARARPLVSPVDKWMSAEETECPFCGAYVEARDV
ncbi:MAG: hypothetical protein K1X53_03265, partial [Candidatus Sumerlaeaceae bacterium]|nr:hypothetical protein [Candidatus Sumerlaeaceae bacterium]